MTVEPNHLARVARSPREIRIRLKAIALKRRVEMIEAECGTRLPVIVFVNPKTEDDKSAFAYFSKTISKQKPHMRIIPINQSELHKV